jgi:5-methyltetrahydrofolate--homocysteine methyltransferase
MSFDTNLRTMMGVTPADGVSRLSDLGVVAAGGNCGRGPGEMLTVATQMAAARPQGLLLIAQSNAGMPHLHGDHFEYDVDPAGMAAHLQELLDLGIDIVGGCCGSTPAHIAAAYSALA